MDYGYDAADAILLERKDDMRRRRLASPDYGDALSLTFAYPVAKRTGPRAPLRRRAQETKDVDRIIHSWPSADGHDVEGDIGRSTALIVFG